MKTASQQLEESLEEFDKLFPILESTFLELPYENCHIDMRKSIKHFLITHTIKLLQAEIERLEEIYKEGQGMNPFPTEAGGVVQDQISHLQEQIIKIKE